MTDYSLKQSLRKVMALLLCAAMGLWALPTLAVEIGPEGSDMGVASVLAADGTLATYTSLPEAAAEANAQEGAKLALEADAELSEPLYLGAAGLSLDLQGHSLRYLGGEDPAISVSGELRIVDSASGGSVYSQMGPAVYAAGENSALSILGGAYRGQTGIYCEGLGQFYLDGASVRAENGGAVVLVNVADAGFGTEMWLLGGGDGLFGAAIYAHNSHVTPISGGYFAGGAGELLVGVGLEEGLALSAADVLDGEGIAYAGLAAQSPRNLAGSLWIEERCGLLFAELEGEGRTGLSYTWYRDGEAVSSGPAAYYLPDETEGGHSFSVSATAGDNTLQSEAYALSLAQREGAAGGALATIGGGEFASLSDAVMAANVSGNCTIVLQQDVYGLQETLYVTAENVSLDLNGHRICADTLAIDAAAPGFLLTDSLGGGGLLRLGSDGAAHITDGAALLLRESGTVRGAGLCSTLGYALLLYGENASLQVENGEIQGGILSLAARAMDIAGESWVRAENGAAVYAQVPQQINISGESRLEGESAVYAAAGAELSLSGGYYRAAQQAAAFAGAEPALPEGYTVVTDGDGLVRVGIPITGSLAIEGSHTVGGALVPVYSTTPENAALRFLWYGADGADGAFELLCEGDSYTLGQADAGRSIKLVALGASDENGSYAGSLESAPVTIAMTESEELSQGDAGSSPLPGEAGDEPTPPASPEESPMPQESPEPQESPALSAQGTPLPIGQGVQVEDAFGAAAPAGEGSESSPSPSAAPTQAPTEAPAEAPTEESPMPMESPAPTESPAAGPSGQPEEAPAESPSPAPTGEEPAAEPTPTLEISTPAPTPAHVARVELSGETLYFENFATALRYAQEHGTQAAPIVVILEADAELGADPGCTGTYAVDLAEYSLRCPGELLPLLFNNAYVRRSLGPDGRYVYSRYTGDTSAYDQCGYYGVALTPAESISLNYFVEADYAGRINGVYFWENGAVVARRTAVSESINGTLCSVYSYSGIAAKEMADGVYCAMYFMDGEATVYINFAGKATSVAHAACEVLATATDERLIQLLVDMLDYGASVQQYKAYNTGSLANSYLSQLTLPNGRVASEYSRGESYDFSAALHGEEVQASQAQGLDSLLRSNSLGLGSTVSVNFYLRVGDSAYTPENLRLLIWTEAQPSYAYGSQSLSLTLRTVSEKAGSDHAAVLGGIRPSDLRLPLYIALYDMESNTLSSVRCISVEGFAAEYQGTDTASVVSQLMYYGVSAEAYGRNVQ